MAKHSALEIEGFGVTYDRYIMTIQQQMLTGQLAIGQVLELPSHGAKAAPSIYSLGYALAGAEVTVPNFDEAMRTHWRALGLEDRLRTVQIDDATCTGFDDSSFDLVWNFVTFSELADKVGYIKEITRLTRRYVMLILCNNFQLGYPWHRIIHRAFKFPWTHGDTTYNYPWRARRFLRACGLKIFEYGTIDSPPWPDPVGFRDIRLHRKGVQKVNIKWEIPFITYLSQNQFPPWMRLLRTYDIPLRKGFIKLPFSHLFYVIAEK